MGTLDALRTWGSRNGAPQEFTRTERQELAQDFRTSGALDDAHAEAISTVPRTIGRQVNRIAAMGHDNSELMRDGQRGLIYVRLRQLREVDPQGADSYSEWFERNKDVMTKVQASFEITKLQNRRTAIIGGVVVVNKETEVEATPATPITYDTYEDIVDGNYAIERDGKTHFYRITRKDSKRRPGTKWIKVQERASDQLFPLAGGPANRRATLNMIREAGPEASRMMFSERLGRCWHCFTSLTDETNPYKAMGLGPICGGKV
jgi:hypothetical protein